MPEEVREAIREDGYYITEGGLKLQFFYSCKRIIGFGMSIVQHSQAEGPKRFSESIFGIAQATGHRLDKLLWDWGLRQGTRGYRSEIWYQTDDGEPQAKILASDIELFGPNPSPGNLPN